LNPLADSHNNTFFQYILYKSYLDIGINIIVEDMKKNCREFLGKEDYKLGDITKEVDTRVKGEIANLRGKEVSKALRSVCDLSYSINNN
jgi:hypothetical protein